MRRTCTLERSSSRWDRRTRTPGCSSSRWAVRTRTPVILLLVGPFVRIRMTVHPLVGSIIQKQLVSISISRVTDVVLSEIRAKVNSSVLYLQIFISIFYHKFYVLQQFFYE